MTSFLIARFNHLLNPSWLFTNWWIPHCLLIATWRHKLAIKLGEAFRWLYQFQQNFHRHTRKTQLGDAFTLRTSCQFVNKSFPHTLWFSFITNGFVCTYVEKCSVENKKFFNKRRRISTMFTYLNIEKCRWSAIENEVSTVIANRQEKMHNCDLLYSLIFIQLQPATRRYCQQSHQKLSALTATVWS
jgi:hypothetical protein